MHGLGWCCHLAEAAQPQAVTVYSSRIEALLKPTLDEYTKQTGVKINLLTDRGGSFVGALGCRRSKFASRRVDYRGCG